MKKKKFLTEAKRKVIIADKEKAIIESFAKTFNKIKRIDENEINEYGDEDYEGASRSIEYGINPYNEESDKYKSLIGKRYAEGAKSDRGSGGIEGIITNIIPTNNGYDIVFDETGMGDVSTERHRKNLVDKVSDEQMVSLIQKGSWRHDDGSVLIYKQVR